MLIRQALLIMTVGLLSQNQTLAQELEVDVSAVKNIVSEWNDAHTVNSVVTFSLLYANTVKFYGSTLSRGKCISMKRSLLEQQRDFVQVITGDLVLTGYSTGAIRCDFVKNVSRNGKAVNYRSYLIVKKFDGKYLIISESDLVTDRNLKNEPDIGTRIDIRDVKSTVFNESDNAIDSTSAGRSKFVYVISIAVLVALATIGLISKFQKWQSTILFRRSERIVKVTPVVDYAKIGLDFEKFIVQRFSINKDFFTLLEWRGDKIHGGIYPQSSRNPDLEYEFKCKGVVRTFSVECKYRSNTFQGSVKLMDEVKYRIYESFHRNKMPVYIVLGLKGEPGNPKELYLIPFQKVKLGMAYSELITYRKRGNFYYDVTSDRLT